jgi:cytochrome c553
MQHAASELRPEQLRELAEWFAGREAAPKRSGRADPDRLASGEELARAGTDDVPACTACHGPGPRDLEGFGGDALEGDFPPLAGQDEAYLITQLRLWRDGVRGGTEVYNLMRVAAQELEEEEIEALAAWYAALDPGTGEIAPSAPASRDRVNPMRLPADH